jgi:hypothetical protein
MGLPSALVVNFGVPPDVAAGLATGRYARWGGHVRDAATGRWVCLLRESEPLHELLASRPAALPPAVGRQLQALGMPLRAVLGGQLFSLGATVAGFAALRRRLVALDQKVDQVLAGVQGLDHQIDWLDRRQDLALQAELQGSLETAAWGERTGRLDQVGSARSALTRAAAHYRLLLAELQDRRLAYAFADGYVAYAQQLVLARLAQARCDWRLDGPQAGEQTAQGLETAFQALTEAFLAPLRDYAGNVAVLLPLGSEGYRQIRQGAEVLREAVRSVQGYRAELAYCRAHGVQLDEWCALGAGASEPCLLILTPREGAAKA